MKSIFFSLCLFLFGQQLHATCTREESTYNQLIQSLSLQCDVDKDCESQDLAWNSCKGPIPFQKGQMDEASLGAIRAHRSELHKKCGFVMPPCPAIPAGKAYCFQRQCELTISGSAISSDPMDDSPFLIRLVDSKTLKLLKKVSVSLVSKQTIYCIRAPCPQPPAQSKKLETDDTGVLTIQSSEIAADNHFSISGYSPKSFRKQQLSDLRGRKVGFDPQSSPSK